MEASKGAKQRGVGGAKQLGRHHRKHIKYDGQDRPDGADTGMATTRPPSTRLRRGRSK